MSPHIGIVAFSPARAARPTLWAVRETLASSLPPTVARGAQRAGWVLVESHLEALAALSPAIAQEAQRLRQRMTARRAPRAWSNGDRRLALDGSRSLVMGVLNVTPDSFSDGGLWHAAQRAVDRGLEMAEEGAAIIDVGGESTRPGAQPVPVEEERRRVLSVVEALADSGLAVSIDTRHAEVARACLEAGALLVNDVTGLRDPSMRSEVAASGSPACLMHMQGEPSHMQQDPRYENVVLEVLCHLEERIAACEQAGIPRQDLIADPGLGFGKRTGRGIDDNVALVAHLATFDALGTPLLVGASRKSFLGHLTGRPVGKRLHGSVAAAVAARLAGADILRVHDVAATVDALRVADAIRSEAMARGDAAPGTAMSWTGPDAPR